MVNSSLSGKPVWVVPFSWIKTLAHLSSESTIMFVEGITGFFTGTLRRLTAMIFGSPNAHTWEVKGLSPRYAIEGVPVIEKGTRGIVNFEETIKKSNYHIAPDDLIKKCKEVLSSNFGVDNNNLLADDFRFQAPIVGPLCKADFIRVYGSFKLEQALPDLSENIFGFTLDPIEPNRVWFFSRGTGTHTGDLNLGGGNIIGPTGTRIEWPVQASSMCFDKDGRLYQLTVGYACDKNIGTTGGLGALLGVLYAINKPLPCPESKPWVPSSGWRVLQYVGKIMEALGKGPGMDRK